MKLSPSIISNASGYKKAGLKYVSFTSLSVAMMALPFSIKICHTGIIVFGLGVVGLTLLMVLMIHTGLVQKDYLFVTFIFLFCSLCITEAALELQKGIVFSHYSFPFRRFQKNK